MKIRNFSLLIILDILVVSIISLFFFLPAPKSPPAPPNPELVAAHSAGVIDRNGTIRVEFTRDFDTSVPVSQDAFRLEPSAKGNLSWGNSYTLEFSPAQPLKPGTGYTAYVDTAKLAMLPPQPELKGAEHILPELKVFSFVFTTSIPNLELVLDPVRIDNDGKVLVSGLLITEKGVAVSEIEKTLQSKELGKVIWTHQGDEHRFSFARFQKMKNRERQQ